MKSFLRFLALAFFMFLFLTAGFSKVTADNSTDTPVPTYDINGYPVGEDASLWVNKDLDFAYGTEPNQYVTQKDQNGYIHGLRIDGTVRTVVVNFRNLDVGATAGQSDFWLCGKTDVSSCSKQKFLHRFSATSGKINVEVCGAGKETLKGKSTDNGDNLGTGGCNIDKDYFHEGFTYRLSVFADNNGETPVVTAEFFVKHSFPLVKISSGNGGKLSYLSPIAVSMWGRRPGVDNDNNYQVIIEGTNNNYKQEYCFKNKKGSGDTVGVNTQGVDEKNGTIVQEHFLTGTGWDTQARPLSEADTHTWGKGNNSSSGLGTGAYLLKINERKSETNDSIRSSLGFNIGHVCEGGYSYIYIYFTLSPKNPSGIDIYRVVYDPNNSDWEDINGLNDNKAPVAPCIMGGPTNDQCAAVNTAIGKINTTPEGFINSIFRIILVIAGFGGIIVMIYAGYILMTSRGDKERVAAARETITSAILGILFIIFSIVILEIIGVDILKIPGLAR